MRSVSTPPILRGTQPPSLGAILTAQDAAGWGGLSEDAIARAKGGGGSIDIHGSAGYPTYFCDWYADTLIRARISWQSQ